MKMRFWVGVVLLAVAAMMFAYRGRMVNYVADKWDRRRLPAAVTYNNIASHAVTTVISSRSEEARAMPNDGEEISPSLPSRGEGPLAPRLGRNDENSLPVEFNLAVPFTSQAPNAVWDHTHEEACEEAVVAMADAFYRGRHFTPAGA